MLIYILALVVLIIVLIAHLFGLDGWYYEVESYDTFMHFIGGAGLGLFVAGLIGTYYDKTKVTYLNVFLGVILGGIAWELFEMYYEITGHPLWSTLYYLDTVKDLIMDALGGVVVTYFMIRKK
jgi:hypothetical protein